TEADAPQPAASGVRRNRLAGVAAALAVLALVLALVFLLPGGDRGETVADSGPGAPAASEPAAVAPPAAAVAPADASLAPLPLAQRRVDIAAAIAGLPHVLGAAWTTESTLRVEVDSDGFDPRARLCPLLEADPDLGASRVQLQAPPGSTRPVRFLQCR